MLVTSKQVVCLYFGQLASPIKTAFCALSG